MSKQWTHVTCPQCREYTEVPMPHHPGAPPQLGLCMCGYDFLVFWAEGAEANAFELEPKDTILDDIARLLRAGLPKDAMDRRGVGSHIVAEVLRQREER